VGARDLAERLERLGLFDRMSAVAAERARLAFARKGHRQSEQMTARRPAPSGRSSVAIVV
jgi:hypothetical protein